MEIKLRVRNINIPSIIGYEYLRNGGWYHTYNIEKDEVPETFSYQNRKQYIRELYIGLNDKNNIEIYEGDKVKFVPTHSQFDINDDFTYAEEFYKTGIIVFERGTFQVKDYSQFFDGTNDWYSLENIDKRYIEVI